MNGTPETLLHLRRNLRDKYIAEWGYSRKIVIDDLIDKFLAHKNEGD